MHLSLGDSESLNDAYLAELAELLDEIDAPWFSDHLGASIHGDELLHEIFPIPLNEATLEHVGKRAEAAAAVIQRPVLVENAAYYLKPPGTELAEHEYFRRLVTEYDVELLLDVNNLWVNAQNHGYDPVEFLDAIPPSRIREIHIGGFTVDKELGLLIDTHGAPPTRAGTTACSPKALRRTGPLAGALRMGVRLQLASTS